MARRGSTLTTWSRWLRCTTPAARGWSTERRRRYANDLGSELTLVGVSARSNRQKADQDPATWMPMEAVHCRYLGEWVITKKRWGLSVDEAERAALFRYAAECPDVTLAYEPAA
ncbi:HNH endonuclease family protein [Streptomyces sp. NPDC097704]|uniref:HNH endonuclease family protein n=1 Tax=Streptomyces sp. NPDC097704 TaxID=3157101 RepID=UPI00331E7891